MTPSDIRARAEALDLAAIELLARAATHTFHMLPGSDVEILDEENFPILEAIWNFRTSYEQAKANCAYVKVVAPNVVLALLSEITIARANQALLSARYDELLERAEAAEARAAAAGGERDAAVERAVREAVEAERRACAQLCDDAAMSPGPHSGQEKASLIAAAIRARSEGGSHA